MGLHLPEIPMSLKSIECKKRVENYQRLQNISLISIILAIISFPLSNLFYPYYTKYLSPFFLLISLFALMISDRPNEIIVLRYNMDQLISNLREEDSERAQKALDRAYNNIENIKNFFLKYPFTGDITVILNEIQNSLKYQLYPKLVVGKNIGLEMPLYKDINNTLFEGNLSALQHILKLQLQLSTSITRSDEEVVLPSEKPNKVMSIVSSIKNTYIGRYNNSPELRFISLMIIFISIAYFLNWDVKKPEILIPIILAAAAVGALAKR